jgi:hypothetical protein
MSNQGPADKRSTTEQILDLLLDALAERQKDRQAGAVTPAPPPTAEWKAPTASARLAAEVQRNEPEAGSSEPVPPPRPDPPPGEQRRPESRPIATRPAPPRPPRRELQAGEEGWEPPTRLPSIHMGKMLLRLAILVAILIVAVNIPVNRYGVSLARIMPESSSLIIRDGLVLKGSGPEIYMLENDKLRWISSMDAFEHLGLTWEDVHVVDDSFLNTFKKGRPIHVLLKCQASPHIYRLENDQKRWIKDIDTFLAEGHVWEDVRFVSCDYLRSIPDGPPIPEDAGPPPQP